MMKPVGLVVLLFGTLAQSGPNISYMGWKGYKPGSWVKQEITNPGGGVSVSGTQTVTLVRYLEEKAVIESTASYLIQGKKEEAKPTRSEIPAREGEGTFRILKALGTESLKVGDTTFKCKVFQAVRSSEFGKAQAKIWFSPKIPGGIVKLEAGSGKLATRLMAIEWEKK